MNRYIAVEYNLYTEDENGKHLRERTRENQPFTFISGMGYTLEAFEKHIVDVPQGEEFDFTLTADEAYGQIDEKRILELDHNIFSINGHFDHDHIYKGADVPMQNEDGMKLYEEIELPLSYVLYDMEKAGIHCSEDDLDEIAQETMKKINKLEKELFDMIELRICQLQLHEIDEFNEYIQVLLAMIQLRNDIIHKELCEMINTSTMQVKQINYFSGKDYHEELKSIEESITSSVQTLGLVPNKKS
mgnify:CR=1 FL=1